MPTQAKSKHMLLIWIAEYACKHLATDMINDLAGDTTETQMRLSDLSSLNVKQILIFSTIMNDVKEKYSEAISAINSLLAEAVELKALDAYLRLSLGLRIKDIMHSLSLPAVNYREKVHSYLSEECILPQNLLKHIFSPVELQGFNKVISDIYNFYMCLRYNKQETEKISVSYWDSFTVSLINVAKIFFQILQNSQPLSTLDKMMEAGDVANYSHCCSEWDTLLATHFSGLNSLEIDSVWKLFLNIRNDYRTCNIKNHSREAQIGNNSSFLVPSSQFEDEEERSWGSPNSNMPHIARFLKKPLIKGCIVRLCKIDSPTSIKIK